MPFHREDNCSLKILQYFVEFGEPFTSNNKNRKLFKKNIQNSFGIQFMISQELVNNSFSHLHSQEFITVCVSSVNICQAIDSPTNQWNERQTFSLRSFSMSMVYHCKNENGKSK